MDPVNNPYSPTAGWPPPALHGREKVTKEVEIALARVLKGRQSNSLVLRGLRGVGKTVLLNQLERKAEALGFEIIKLEVPDAKGGHLLARLVPQLRAVLIRLSRRQRAEEYAKRGLAALQNIAALFKLRYEGISVGIDPATPEATTGDLEIDLPDLLRLVSEAAQHDGRGIALLVDEIQYLEARELSALSLSVHALAQKQLPFILIGSGLPQISAQMADAKSYSERLFDFPLLGPLDEISARRALEDPAREEGVSYEAEAIDLILEQTEGYPFFLQTWGKFAWDVADKSPIKLEDVAAAEPAIRAHLDTNFFRVRFDRCSDAEKRYLRGLAELGPGAHSSGKIAKVLATDSRKVARLRAGLIESGMIYAPSYGETAFTVPQFDAFMKRIMPDLEPYQPTRTRK